MPPTIARDTTRPFAFLVSTTACARDIRASIGGANYSYYFAVEALAPALEELGTWRLVEEPESRLAFLAAKARAAGYRPVHLAVHPPHDVYLSPALPNVLLTFWEFPRVPDRDFGHDTRQNWARIARQADLILAPCRLTAQAFRASGVSSPIADVRIPLAPTYFDLPAWDPGRSWTMPMRHVVWVEGPEVGETPGAPADSSSWPSPARAIAETGRRAIGSVRRLVRERLRPETRGRIKRLARRVIRARTQPPPRLPLAPLTLSGLVYTSIFNFSDARKNPEDILSAFLIAFRDRPDVTLVLKLNCPPEREVAEVAALRRLYARMGLRHRCRVVVLTDYLDEPRRLWLLSASTYYVNASRAEGACLPLQEALAAGRPAMAPRHTAMADYFDARIGFPIGAHPEPTCWPHDPERRLETTWHRLAWSDLHDHYLTSADAAEHDPARYAALADAARHRMRSYAGRPAAVTALRRALERLPETPALARPPSVGKE